jgi:hypothetical protein
VLCLCLFHLVVSCKQNETDIRVIADAYQEFPRLCQYLEKNADVRSQTKIKSDFSDRLSMKLSYEEHPFVYNILDSYPHGLRNARVSTRVPVEYRMYQTGSYGTKWHCDQRVLPYDTNYVEAILTISNTSDCVLEYVSKKNKMERVALMANTLVLVPPETVLHKATELNYGERHFLKFIVEFDK